MDTLNYLYPGFSVASILKFLVKVFRGLYVILMFTIAITKTCPCNKQIFFLALKLENSQLKKFDIFLVFAQNIDCGYTLEPPRRGGSNEYPQSMFWSKNKKNRYTPVYPIFAI